MGSLVTVFLIFKEAAKYFYTSCFIWYSHQLCMTDSFLHILGSICLYIYFYFSHSDRCIMSWWSLIYISLMASNVEILNNFYLLISHLNIFFRETAFYFSSSNCVTEIKSTCSLFGKGIWSEERFIDQEGGNSPCWCGSVGWVLAYKPKVHKFNSQSRAHAWGASQLKRQPHIDVFLSPFPSLKINT